MRKTRATHEDLVDPDRERVLGTLTSKAWAKLSYLEARSKWYSMTPQEIADLEYDPMDEVLHTARQSSGSIGGAHRRDLVEAMRVSSQPQTGLSLQVGQQDREEPGKPEKREKRRGL
jgi:hypothetical protein